VRHGLWRGRERAVRTVLLRIDSGRDVDRFGHLGWLGTGKLPFGKLPFDKLRASRASRAGRAGGGERGGGLLRAEEVAEQ